MKDSTSTAAVYEWNYSAQMIEIRLAEAAGELDRNRLGQDIFSERFLTRRPLLQALEAPKGAAPVLLIDELDRTDEAFEAFLLEVLSDFQVTIPELGTIKAEEPPIVIITSNRTREVHDALKRRCLYHWVGYPDAAREIGHHQGQAAARLRARWRRRSSASSRRCAAAISTRRRASPRRSTGSRRLHELDASSLDPQTVNDTLGVLLKYQDDIVRMEGSEAKRILDQIKAEIRMASQVRRDDSRNGIARAPEEAASPSTSCILPACCARRGCRSVRAM